MSQWQVNLTFPNRGEAFEFYMEMRDRYRLDDSVTVSDSDPHALMADAYDPSTWRTL